MHLFAAISLPEASHAALHTLVHKLQPKSGGVTWVKPDNMHLTLRFYGEVSEEQLPALSCCLEKRLAPFKPPELLVRGVGAFPSIKKPSVVWAGIETVSGDLCGIQGATEQAAREIGLAPETRAFHPHVTIARLRTTATTSLFASLLQPYQEPGKIPEFGPDFCADKILLFRSLLTPRGPVYTIVREIILK